MFHEFCLLQLSSLQSSLFDPIFKEKGQSELYIVFGIIFNPFIKHKVESQLYKVFGIIFDPIFFNSQSELYIKNLAIYIVFFLNIQFSLSYIQFLALNLILFLNIKFSLNYIQFLALYFILFLNVKVILDMYIGICIILVPIFKHGGQSQLHMQVLTLPILLSFNTWGFFVWLELISAIFYHYFTALFRCKCTS